jgi:molecular chaperone GrpE
VPRRIGSRLERIQDNVDDSIRQALLDRFSAWLDTAEDAPETLDDPGEAADLFSVFVEIAGLRTEVRTESRLMKDALDQFRGVFDTLQASHTTLQRELDRARTETRDQRRGALRPLLLDIIDLRDRLTAALKMSAAVQPRWHERLWRRQSARGEAWHEGLQMTLRRFDRVLQDRGVEAMQLLGRPLDPRLARVVGTAVDRTAPEGTVVEEVRAGFLWEEQVLRTAEVTVSKAHAGTGEAP